MNYFVGRIYLIGTLGYEKHLTQCVRGPRTKKSVLVVGVAVVIRRLLRRLSLLRRLVGIVFLVSIVDMLISVVSIN